MRFALQLWPVLALLMLLPPPGASGNPRIEPLSAFTLSTLVVRTAQGEHKFDVWLADSAPRQAQGLMFVTKLARGSGMLFIYREPRMIGMWMKNTLIPLDMLFIAPDGRITRIARNASPRSLDTISSLGPVVGVLEVGGGECERLGIEVGDRVVHPAFQPTG